MKTQHDEATMRMLASFAKAREQRQRTERSKAEVDSEMLRDFDAAEAAAINGGRS